MKKDLLVAALNAVALTACGPIPVQMTSKQSSEQTSSQTSSNAADQSSSQSASHASDAKQGTTSMPVIIICNNTNSAAATCASVPGDIPLLDPARSKLKKEALK